MTVKLRYKQPDGDTSQLISVAVRDRVGELTPNLGFAPRSPSSACCCASRSSRARRPGRRRRSWRGATAATIPTAIAPSSCGSIELAAALDAQQMTSPQAGVDAHEHAREHAIHSRECAVAGCCSCARRCSSGGRSISRSSFRRRCRRSAGAACRRWSSCSFHGAVAALAVAAVRALSDAQPVGAAAGSRRRSSRQSLPRFNRSTGRRCRTRRCPATSCRSRYSRLSSPRCWLLYLRRGASRSERSGHATARARSFR